MCVIYNHFGLDYHKIIVNLVFSICFQAYANLLKANMDGLKKKDRKTKGDKKAKAMQ